MANIVGIDLGTTFSALATLNAIGRPEIVPNADGERLTPSAIFFDEENPDVIRVGVEAVNSRHLNAERSVRWIKRHVGDADYVKCVDGKNWTPVGLSALILKKLKADCSAVHGEIRDAVISVPAHFDEIRRKATMEAGTTVGLNVVGIVNEPVAAALYYATTRPVSGKLLKQPITKLPMRQKHENFWNYCVDQNNNTYDDTELLQQKKEWDTDQHLWYAG